MNIAIAVVCFTRNEFLLGLEASILKLIGLANTSVSVFIDGPKTDQDLRNISSAEQFFLSSEIKNNAKNFSVKRRIENVGAWRNKTESLAECFSSGADVVLLLEDDVIISLDSLKFIDAVGDALLNSKSLCTAGLYSTSLEFSGKRSFKRAEGFLRRNPEAFSACACRTWPFPWGLIIDKKNFVRFIDLGWTGNDQHMGRILLENNGFDFFPVISRARHLGVLSSITGKEVKTGLFPDFSEIYEAADFSKVEYTDAPALKALGDFYYSKLIPDDILKFDKLCVIYGSDKRSDEKLKKFEENNSSLSIVPLVYCENNLVELVTRIYSSVYVVILDDEDVGKKIIRALKLAGVAHAVMIDDFDLNLLKI